MRFRRFGSGTGHDAFLYRPGRSHGSSLPGTRKGRCLSRKADFRPFLPFAAERGPSTPRRGTAASARQRGGKAGTGGTTRGMRGERGKGGNCGNARGGYAEKRERAGGCAGKARGTRGDPKTCKNLRGKQRRCAAQRSGRKAQTKARNARGGEWEKAKITQERPQRYGKKYALRECTGRNANAQVNEEKYGSARRKNAEKRKENAGCIVRREESPRRRFNRQKAVMA